MSYEQRMKKVRVWRQLDGSVIFTTDPEGSPTSTPYTKRKEILQALSEPDIVKVFAKPEKNRRNVRYTYWKQTADGIKIQINK